MDVLEFVEQLKIELWPVQRFILKAMYGLPLEEDTPTIELPDSWRKESVQMVTEAQYMTHLFQKGQASSPVVQDEAPSRGVVLVMGRRSGKSFLVALVCLYETYRLATGQNLNTKRLMPTDVYGTLVVGPTRDMAQQAYRYMVDLMDRSPDLDERMANQTQNYVRFQTDADIAADGPWKGSRRQARASVSLATKAALAKGLRGGMLGFAVMDEADFFPLSSVEDVFSILQRMLQTLRGRWLLASSPAPSTPFLRQQFELAGVGHSGAGVLGLQIPTWEANPHVDQHSLQTAHDRDPITFMAEFGAMFMTTVTIHIPLSLHNGVLEEITDQGRGETFDSVVVEGLQDWLKRE